MTASHTQGAAPMSFVRFFRCERGHESSTANGQDLTRCPACEHGRPCAGKLRRVGPGARGPRKAKAVR